MEFLQLVDLHDEYGRVSAFVTGVIGYAQNCTEACYLDLCHLPHMPAQPMPKIFRIEQETHGPGLIWCVSN